MYRASSTRALIAFACAFLLASAAFAPAAQAAEKTGEDARANSLYPGSWSLQFQITDQLGLKPFNGMMISAKRHLSRQSALRLGLAVAADWNNTTGTGRDEVADTLYRSDDRDLDENRQRFTLDLSYMRYPWPGSYVNFFWGVGPLVSFSRDERTTAASYTYEDREHHDSTRAYQRSWDLGTGGLVGVEWFLSKHFSFHSEYKASITYGQSFSETEEINYSTVKTRHLSERTLDGWDFRSVYVTFGLSVYF
jgi:hypothetical protein